MANLSFSSSLVRLSARYSSLVSQGFYSAMIAAGGGAIGLRLVASGLHFSARLGPARASLFGSGFGFDLSPFGTFDIHLGRRSIQVRRKRFRDLESDECGLGSGEPDPDVIKTIYLPF